MRRHAPGSRSRRYALFGRIDGRHPFRKAVPRGFVDYPVRRVRGSRVVYFNFALAREMGLLPGGHPDRLNADLSRAILETFSLQIVNEHDRMKGRRFPARELKPHPCMATRYLQLQHPDGRGLTSGDGRSVWNGTFTRHGVTWDISSCGTGVTRLCPATAETGKFFRTGTRIASYGCGTASLEDGLAAALLSETFHRNGIATERVLAIIELASGYAVNVRAGRNLLRPSHFFLYTRQDDLASLRGAVDLFIERQIANGDFPRLRGTARYRRLAVEMARTFGRTAALFEREYVFCWLDWDGDNILADGGIIDYGSVRQLGLYHREYRFDDGPRWSTTIPEQKKKARLIVQNFAQIRDALIDGVKRPLRGYAHDPVFEEFERAFQRTRDDLLLRHVGFTADTRRRLMKRVPALVRRLDRSHGSFERARSARGPVPASDGVTWNAVYSTRDILRELPERLGSGLRPLPADDFLRLALSTYAGPEDRRPTPYRRRMARRFQRDYVALLQAAARLEGCPVKTVLRRVVVRSASLNRFDRLTGDGAVHAARRLVRLRRRLSSDAFHAVIRRFIERQERTPDLRLVEADDGPAPAEVRRALDGLIELTVECRHSL